MVNCAFKIRRRGNLTDWVEAMKEGKRVSVSVFSNAQAPTDCILATAATTLEPTRPPL